MGEAIAEQLQDQAAQIIRLRSELAGARRALLAGNDTVLANKKLQEDNAAKDARIAIIMQALDTSCANVTNRDARIAELDAHMANEYARCEAWKARAERAEAELKTMREALALVDADVRHHLRSDAIDHALLRKHAVAAVRDALAPSPAGREG